LNYLELIKTKENYDAIFIFDFESSQENSIIATKPINRKKKLSSFVKCVET
jgi:hypothetical protein